MIRFIVQKWIIPIWHFRRVDRKSYINKHDGDDIIILGDFNMPGFRNNKAIYRHWSWLSISNHQFGNTRSKIYWYLFGLRNHPIEQAYKLRISDLVFASNFTDISTIQPMEQELLDIYSIHFNTTLTLTIYTSTEQTKANWKTYTRWDVRVSCS